MAELKPCPFCGGKAKVFDDAGSYVIWCESCPGGVEDNYLTEDEIVLAWNRRVE